MLSNCDAQQRAFDQTEKNNIDVLQRSLQKSLTDLSQQKQLLIKEETDEILHAQQDLQIQSLTSRLANYSLESASIPGVGAELKRRLSEKGIKTAADIANVHTTSTSWGGGISRG